MATIRTQILAAKGEGIGAHGNSARGANRGCALLVSMIRYHRHSNVAATTAAEEAARRHRKKPQQKEAASSLRQVVCLKADGVRDRRLVLRIGDAAAQQAVEALVFLSPAAGSSIGSRKRRTTVRSNLRVRTTTTMRTFAQRPIFCELVRCGDDQFVKFRAPRKDTCVHRCRRVTLLRLLLLRFRC